MIGKKKKRKGERKLRKEKKNLRDHPPTYGTLCAKPLGRV